MTFAVSNYCLDEFVGEVETFITPLSTCVCFCIRRTSTPESSVGFLFCFVCKSLTEAW
jgi:hypothetical protein